MPTLLIKTKVLQKRTFIGLCNVPKKSQNKNVVEKFLSGKEGWTLRRSIGELERGPLVM
jgi:hypothetical protein